MASDAIGRGPVEKEIAQSAEDGSKQGDFQRDVEVGPEMIDIDRIERVYRYVLSNLSNFEMLIKVTASSIDAYYQV